MTAGFQDMASAVARAWVRLYTNGMPPDLRDARRAEIDADLWDHKHDAEIDAQGDIRVAAEILLRTLFGIPDDIGWRREVIHARRGIVFERRLRAMQVSVRNMRTMAMCAIWGGALMAVGHVVDFLLGYPLRVYTSETSWRLDPTWASWVSGGGALTLFFGAAGIAGLYIQQRGRASKAALVGFPMVIAGFGLMGVALAISAIFGIEGVFGVSLNVLIIPGALLLGIGFLLTGIGMSGPLRLVLLCLAVLDFSPIIFRSDSPAGAISSALSGIGLVVIGCWIWFGTRPASGPGAKSLTATPSSA